MSDKRIAPSSNVFLFLSYGPAEKYIICVLFLCIPMDHFLVFGWFWELSPMHGIRQIFFYFYLFYFIFLLFIYFFFCYIMCEQTKYKTHSLIAISPLNSTLSHICYYIESSHAIYCKVWCMESHFIFFFVFRIYIYIYKSIHT